MPTLEGINQLGSDPDAVGRPLNAPLQHILNTQFLTYLLDLHRLSLVSEGRISGDHKQPWYLGKGSDDVLGDSITQELLLRVIAHICKRQHGNGRQVGQGKRHLLHRSRLNWRRTEIKVPDCPCSCCHNENYESSQSCPLPVSWLWFYRSLGANAHTIHPNRLLDVLDSMLAQGLIA